MSNIDDIPLDPYSSTVAIIVVLLVLAWLRQGGARSVWYHKPSSLENMTISNQVFSGEPPTSLAKAISQMVNLSVVAALAYAVLAYAPQIEKVFLEVESWPVLAGAISILCLVVALVLNFIRVLFHGMMRRVGAIPSKDQDGTDCLMFLGDVPPIRWLYSAWPRVWSFLLVLAFSLISAFFGSAALTGLVSVSPLWVFGGLFTSVFLVPYFILGIVFALWPREQKG